MDGWSRQAFRCLLDAKERFIAKYWAQCGEDGDPGAAKRAWWDAWIEFCRVELEGHELLLKHDGDVEAALEEWGVRCGLTQTERVVINSDETRRIQELISLYRLGEEV